MVHNVSQVLKLKLINAIEFQLKKNRLSNTTRMINAPTITYVC